MSGVQFVTMNYQAMHLLYNDCPYPKRCLYLYFAYVLSLLLLFANFYFRKHGGGGGGSAKAVKQA